MMYYVIFFLIQLAWATTPQSLDETYPRDNSFCHFNGKTLEILIRSSHRHAETDEIGCGEHVLFKKDGQYFNLPLDKSHLENFRFMKEETDICKRMKGFSLDENTLALLFLKRSAPSEQKLIIQLFDKKSFTPKEFIITEHNSDEAIQIKNGFAFNSHSLRTDIDSGKIIIEGETLNYQDRKFSTWISYTSKGFETLPSMTYQNFSYKEYFKDEAEFLKDSGWDGEKKNFSNTIIYFAVNHKTQKSCVLILSERTKLTGIEAWRCR